MDDQKVSAYTENVVILRDKATGELTGIIAHERVYGLKELDSESIAKLIDPEFGVISRRAPGA